jgi:eight-cysteine-cluster-containing protein
MNKKTLSLIVVALAVAAAFYISKQSGIELVPLNFDDKVESTNTAPVGGCFVGGCSGQICSEEEGVISTCEYREEYACYQKAKCERQSNGQCGWTPTAGLQACLDSVQ